MNCQYEYKWGCSHPFTQSEHVQVQINGLLSRIAHLEGRLTVAYEGQEKKIQEILEGIGGAVWRTNAGHARGIALLSSGHLKNIIAYPSVSGKISTLCQKELDRREIDALWRDAEEHKAIELELGKSRYATKAKPKRKPAKRRRK